MLAERFKSSATTSSSGDCATTSARSRFCRIECTSVMSGLGGVPAALPGVDAGRCRRRTGRGSGRCGGTAGRRSGRPGRGGAGPFAWVPADLGCGDRQASVWRAWPSARVARRRPGERRRARRRSGLAGEGKELLVPRLGRAGRWDILLGRRRVPPYAARRRFARRVSVRSGRPKGEGKEIKFLATFNVWRTGGLAARPGSCPKNRRPDQERTKTWARRACVVAGGRGTR